MEFMALENHRKAIQAELAADAHAHRQAQASALTYILTHHGSSQRLAVEEVVSVLIAATGRLLVIESGLGITTGRESDRTRLRVSRQTGEHRRGRHRRALTLDVRHSPNIDVEHSVPSPWRITARAQVPFRSIRTTPHGS
jgi:hypothetical protein